MRLRPAYILSAFVGVSVGTNAICAEGEQRKLKFPLGNVRQYLKSSGPNTSMQYKFFIGKDEKSSEAMPSCNGVDGAVSNIADGNSSISVTITDECIKSIGDKIRGWTNLNYQSIYMYYALSSENVLSQELTQVVARQGLPPQASASLILFWIQTYNLDLSKDNLDAAKKDLKRSEDENASLQRSIDELKISSDVEAKKKLDEMQKVVNEKDDRIKRLTKQLEEQAQTYQLSLRTACFAISQLSLRPVGDNQSPVIVPDYCRSATVQP